MGWILTVTGKIEPSAHYYREALRRQPGHAVAISGLISAFESLGRLNEAEELSMAFVRAAPDTPLALCLLARLALAGRYEIAENDLAKMRELLNSKDMQASQAVTLAFALADILDRQHAYDEAFRYYQQANDLQRRLVEGSGRPFQKDNFRRLVDRLIGSYSHDYFHNCRGVGIDSELPVFVVGMPRSGTSLVEQILASHPQVYGAGELMDISEISADLAERFGGAGGEAANLSGSQAGLLRGQGEEYLRSLAETGGQAVRVIDKLPTNYLHLGLIATMFPKARIIHCIRDPRDTCLSCYFHEFRLPYMNSLEHLGFAYRQYERLMVHWRAVLPMPILEVRYEELVEDAERMSRQLVSFCGQEWDEACLRFHQNRRAVNTPSVHQVRQPVYKSAVARWRRYEKHLEPLFRALGQQNESSGVLSAGA
jgi:tetratricopeptide (TPR) repeat protein